MAANVQSWSVSDSLKLYGIENWGNQYFSINPSGHLTVHPFKGSGPGIDLMQVIDEIRNSKGLEMPVVVRFQDIIRHRVEALNEAFIKVISELGYKGRFKGVYPIKVNQMSEVVEEILDAGRRYDFGLEAGSKAELAAVIALNTSDEALIICNGYKDKDFITLALLGQKLGKKVVIVIEKISELHHVLKISEEMEMKPLIGVRCKLVSKGSGKWESSAGDTAKFGLTTPELIHFVNILTEKNLQDCCQLLHFHIGSQVPDIRAITQAVKEGARIYGKLVKMGLNIKNLDMGGGLGIDYDGSRTNFQSSVNYSLEEYVSSVVYAVQEICDAEEVAEPILVTESGRALVAYHSALFVDVFGKIKLGSTPPIDMSDNEDEADVVKEMRFILDNLTSKNLLEYYHDSIQHRDDAFSLFKLGFLSLQDKGKVEILFWKICRGIYKQSKRLRYVPEELEELHKKLADQYMCNFSVFQSLPDHWAIDHLFPIVPVHRLDEEPSCEATLVDITCDSDGKVRKFIDLKDTKETLPLHHLKEGEPYYLGVFLIGAYQDVLGDFHNLFGSVNEVHVFLDETEPHGYYLEEIIRGSDVASVLSLLQYSATDLSKRIKERIDKTAREGKIKPREGVILQNFYESVLRGYTYMGQIN